MSSAKNINTLDYWDRRFGTGDWEAKGGYSQTRAFAESQILYFGLPRDFSGILCDFGCGAGDAFPVYRAAYPNAKLVGLDFSSEAIQLCRAKYSDIAEFIEGDYASVPNCDVVIISNVLEHLDEDKSVVKKLLERCNRLFVVVPYREQNLCTEHVRSYDMESFSEFSVIRKVVFASRGWSEFGLRGRILAINMMNILRRMLGRQIRLRKLQIMFEISGNL